MKGFHGQNGKPVEMSFWPYKYVLYWKDFLALDSLQCELFKYVTREGELKIDFHLP